jgi:hypothetical protein
MTSIRRSSRIAAQPTEVRYRKDGSIYHCQKESTVYISKYVSRMAKFFTASGSFATVKAAVELLRYAIANPLPIKHTPSLRFSLLDILSQTIREFPHPSIITIGYRYIDFMDKISKHSDYVWE